jgi:hypothetical protein
MESIRPSSQLVRDSVRSSVETVLWLDKVSQSDSNYANKLALAGQNRCLVCTLPLGTCEHSSDWIFERETLRDSDENYKSALEREIEDVLELVGGDTIHKDEETGAPDMQNLRWAVLDALPTDRIDATEVTLFAPDDRIWHSSVNFEDKLLVIFGGLRYKGSNPFQPFHVFPNQAAFTFEVLGDLRLFDTARKAWSGLRGNARNRSVNKTFCKPNLSVANFNFPSPPHRYGKPSLVII